MEPLYSERKRIAALEDREARGESVWSVDVPPAARTKIYWALNDFLVYRDFEEDHWDTVRTLVTRSRGFTALTRGVNDARADIRTTLAEADVPLIADILEACASVLNFFEERGETERTVAEFAKSVDEILASYRIAFEVVGSQVIEFESRELHSNVVVPALSLFGGDPRFLEAEKAYQEALREVSSDDGAPDAITDAGRALQHVLVALGCTGNALGPLLGSAKKKGLLGPADAQISEGIANLVGWVSADRNMNGDAHQSGADFREDGWLTIHVVGALALRLAAGKPRGKPQADTGT